MTALEIARAAERAAMFARRAAERATRSRPFGPRRAAAMARESDAWQAWAQAFAERARLERAKLESDASDASVDCPCTCETETAS